MEIVEIIRNILTNNLCFVNDCSSSYFLPFQSSQHPIVTLITCSDARVQPNLLFSDPIDRIFTIENIGNQILPSEGSVDYGILHLKTPILFILGHSDCGAIKTFMKGYANEKESIRKELDYLRPALKSGPLNFSPENLQQNILNNIHYQVKVAVQKYSQAIQKKELAVVGAFYDFTNEFRRGYGKINIVNFNNQIINPEKFEKEIDGK